MAHQVTAMERGAMAGHAGGGGGERGGGGAYDERETLAEVVDTSSKEALDHLTDGATPTDPHEAWAEEEADAHRMRIAHAEEKRRELIRGTIRKSIEASVILPLRPELWDMLRTDQDEEGRLVAFIQTLRFEHQS